MMTNQACFLLQQPGCMGIDDDMSGVEMAAADSTAESVLRALGEVFSQIGCAPTCLVVKWRVGG